MLSRACQPICCHIVPARLARQDTCSLTYASSAAAADKVISGHTVPGRRALLKKLLQIGMLLLQLHDSLVSLLQSLSLLVQCSLQLGTAGLFCLPGRLYRHQCQLPKAVGLDIRQGINKRAVEPQHASEGMCQILVTLVGHSSLLRCQAACACAWLLRLIEKSATSISQAGLTD